MHAQRRATGGVALMVMLFSFALFGATSAPADASAQACGDNFFNLGQQIDSAGAPLLHCVLPKRKEEEADEQQEAGSGAAVSDKSHAGASPAQCNADLDQLLELPVDLGWVREHAPQDSMSMRTLGEHLGRSGLDVERAYLDVDDKEAEQTGKQISLAAIPSSKNVEEAKPPSRASKKMTLFIPAPRTARERAQQQRKSQASSSDGPQYSSEGFKASRSSSFVKAARTAFRLLGATGGTPAQSGSLEQQDFFALELGLTGPKHLRSSAAIVEQLLAGARSVHRT